ncbi:hypothetical protein C7974DRAFT_375099 [Boeremia exigua]|uniref:uncharacterized protein n=1 Tax=Boeremia exigua TaxID=749465 RepID=UPI001E8E6B8F|nr:uncharacterized protein C7974DRAFT_375099 [Boeremia exigua]KAH6632945.1 hypothetical protein C7974DRAFT_375099 [Boeremia exigua]
MVASEEAQRIVIDRSTSLSDKLHLSTISHSEYITPLRWHQNDQPPGGNGGDKPTKKRKTGDKEDENEIETAKLQKANAGKYQLVSGNTDPPEVKKADASKLTLHFKDVKTGKQQMLSYPKAHADIMDWNNKDHVQRLQKWRRQVFRRHGFQDRGVTNWQPQEEAFLELLYRLLQQRANSGQVVRRPKVAQVMEHFNAFFEGKVIADKGGNQIPPRTSRKEDSISSKLKRGDSLGNLVTTVKAQLVDDRSVELYLPSITDAQLNRFIADGLSLPQGQNDVPVTKKGAGGTSAEDPGETGNAAAGSKTPGTVTIISRPVETAAVLTDSEEIKTMLEDGWSIPTISDTTEAVEEVDESFDTLEDSWMYKAVESLEDRWKRRDFGLTRVKGLSGIRSDWYSDLADDTKQVRGLEERRLEASHVNALLAYVACPPIGYGGDVNALMGTIKALSKWERALVRQNQRALALQHDNAKAKAPGRDS